ncbi:MAG: hypothetical protein ACRCZ0_08845 [Cetobacterium sp.]
MKELKNVFTPEISPIHKVDFSVAAQANLAFASATGALVPAGTILTGDALSVVELSKSTGADASCILMHDVQTEVGVDKYSVGVMIEGVVYEDVMILANDQAIVTGAKSALTGIKFYGVKTLKK